MRNVIAKGTVLFLLGLTLGVGAVHASSNHLPRHAPIPEVAPRLIPPPPSMAMADAPLPEQREQPKKPTDAPVPEKRPEPLHIIIGTLIPPPTMGSLIPPSVTVPPQTAPIPQQAPPVKRVIFRPTPPPAAARFACRADLRKLGVTFKERAPLSDPREGCSVPNPIAVSALSSTIKIGPEAVMNCDLADQLARFIKNTASPIAERTFGSPIASISQASAYVCRDRHGTGKISEHAFGNAVDIARFVLEDGTDIDVKDYGDSDQKRTTFLNEVRKAACGPFRTVLGPGADADHALHFHFDLEPRKSKHAFCQ